MSRDLASFETKMGFRPASNISLDQAERLSRVQVGTSKQSLFVVPLTQFALTHSLSGCSCQSNFSMALAVQPALALPLSSLD